MPAGRGGDGKCAETVTNWEWNVDRFNNSALINGAFNVTCASGEKK